MCRTSDCQCRDACGCGASTPAAFHISLLTKNEIPYEHSAVLDRVYARPTLCVCIYIHICIYKYMYLYVSIYVLYILHTHVRMYVRTCVFVYAYVHLSVSVCLYVCM